MGNSEMASELEKMRAELAALKQTRSDAAQQADANTATAIATAEVEEPSASSEDSAAAIKNQFEELTDLLKDEIGELPTITTVVVFSLGILMGRLMR